MDERYLAQATQEEQHRRDDALLEINRQLTRPGQPYCDDCDELIPEDRRKAYPAALRCVHCQNAFELFMKGHAR